MQMGVARPGLSTLGHRYGLLHGASQKSGWRFTRRDISFLLMHFEGGKTSNYRFYKDSTSITLLAAASCRDANLPTRTAIPPQRTAAGHPQPTIHMSIMRILCLLLQSSGIL